MTDEYKHLNGMQLKKEECFVLKYLKNKREAEDKKYKKIYKN